MTILESVDTNRLPLGNSDFSDIRERKKIYIDKTDLLYKIARQDTPIFFSRPRRFGKSLLINTLHSLFSNGLKYFHGLDIEKKWNDKQYQVIHLDYSGIAEKNSQEFKRSLGDRIVEEFGVRGKVSLSDEQGIRDPDSIVNEILKKTSNCSIVLLVDEYDAPLTHHIDEPDELKEITKTLNNFYSTVKQYSGKFRLIFITGVIRASHVSIFSAFNNLIDLSLDDEFNSLLGFTESDIKVYLNRYIENASIILKMSKELLYNRIKQYYDGFQFSIGAKERVYNPWSILSFLKLSKDGFKNYWFESGGTPSLILQYIRINKNFDFLDYNKRDVYIDIKDLSRKYEITNIPKNILFYQTGYLSIGDETDGTARLSLPNIEVEESLLQLYIKENNLSLPRELRQTIKKLSDAIDKREIQYIIGTFNKILNECVSVSSTIFTDERSVRDILYAALINIPSLQVIKERETSLGKSDLELITSKTYMIIEFKRTYPDRGPEASLKLALEQINKNRYGSLFSQAHTLYRVGMVISSEKKIILQDYCKEI